jgi:hypothetical protein
MCGDRPPRADWLNVDAGPRVIAVEASYRTIEAALKAEIEKFGHNNAKS